MLSQPSRMNQRARQCRGTKVWVVGRGEGEGVEEEEGEDDGDGEEDAPPEVAVHLCFGGLLALVEVFHGCVESVESPDIERCQRSGQWQDDQ